MCDRLLVYDADGNSIILNKFELTLKNEWLKFGTEKCNDFISAYCRREGLDCSSLSSLRIKKLTIYDLSWEA